MVYIPFFLEKRYQHQTQTSSHFPAQKTTTTCTFPHPSSSPPEGGIERRGGEGGWRMKEGNVIDVPSNSVPVFPRRKRGGKRKNWGIKKSKVCVCVCVCWGWAKNTRQKVFSVGIAQPFQTRVKQCRVALSWVEFSHEVQIRHTTAGSTKCNFFVGATWNKGFWGEKNCIRSNWPCPLKSTGMCKYWLFCL